MHTVEKVKALAKIRTPESFDTLLEIFRSDENIDVRREAVSSIGRHNDSARIYDFLREEAFSRDNPMELIYQMFQTCLKTRYSSHSRPRLITRPRVFRLFIIRRIPVENGRNIFRVQPCIRGRTLHHRERFTSHNTPPRSRVREHKIPDTLRLAQSFDTDGILLCRRNFVGQA